MPPHAPARTARPRRYLMCRPTHFTVDYAINPWMDPATPTDTPLAIRQWERLYATYVSLGHTVELIEPVPGLPDMVFAANGATVLDGRVLVANFRHSQRVPESDAYQRWFRTRGFREVRQADHVNEGEGDHLVAGGVVLAGTGFRTERASHAEARALFGVPVVSLTLVDPRFYHLDTALAVLDDDQVMYYPGAFSPESRAALRALFPGAILAERADAEVFGLNAVSDGRHVLLPSAARRLATRLAAQGFEPIPVDLSELLKSGGGAKCCTLELRHSGRAVS
ncbi:dimethylargininase [Kitasatospora sp. NPDC050543]|uniref:dimethylargininase n=1 Tax=Kitasatospora sp. NPDC050543 TaxID=3364054 RepID=UPI0037992E2D